MEAIREPCGRALEYSFLACDPYYGACTNHCSYCYVAGMMRRSREQWEVIPLRPREGFLKQLRKDAEKYRGTDKRVLLSFTSDVYCEPAVKSGLTRQVLEVLREFDIPWQVLTKCGTAAIRDFDLYGPNDAFATTLTFIEDSDSLQVEPGAALPLDRIEAIKEAHARGIKTWASMEPVYDPRQSVILIEQTAEFVDLFKLGKLNHDAKREAQFDWSIYAWRATQACFFGKRPFVIKEDLRPFCNFGLIGECQDDPRIVTRKEG
jgi:DNA repair photolyase